MILVSTDGSELSEKAIVTAAKLAAILKVAQERDVRFIVMASRGLGTLGSLFIGSSTQQVLAKADRPVLVVR